mmetsp:Transcript_15107/g.53781  ORF Transcript_15107/g.53781 Transcript_15107/m.53781 type:complete len:220 (-) Transcript_15107:95-754(-)
MASAVRPPALIPRDAMILTSGETSPRVMPKQAHAVAAVYPAANPTAPCDAAPTERNALAATAVPRSRAPPWGDANARRSAGEPCAAARETPMADAAQSHAALSPVAKATTSAALDAAAGSDRTAAASDHAAQSMEACAAKSAAAAGNRIRALVAAFAASAGSGSFWKMPCQQHSASHAPSQPGATAAAMAAGAAPEAIQTTPTPCKAKMGPQTANLSRP